MQSFFMLKTKTLIRLRGCAENEDADQTARTHRLIGVFLRAFMSEASLSHVFCKASFKALINGLSDTSVKNLDFTNGIT